MDLNKKILKVGLILVASSLIFAIGFALVYRLDNPVFLKMYVEQYIQSNQNSVVVDNFRLSYITNISDKRKITDIYFEEEPDIEVDVSYGFNHNGFSFFNNNSQNSQNGYIYGRYVLKPLYVHMDLSKIQKEYEELELNNAKITFNDGSTIDVNLGRIILFKDVRNGDDIKTVSTSSSNTGTSTFTARINKDIKLLSIESPLLEDLEDYFDISVGDVDYRKISGIEYKKDKLLDIHAKVKTPEDKYMFFDIKPKLYYEDKEGNISYTRIYNIKYIPKNFDIKGVFHYLKSRGEI